MTFPACDYCRTVPGHDRSKPCRRFNCDLPDADVPDGPQQSKDPAPLSARQGAVVRAVEVLDALRAHHKGAALVSEVVITDEGGRLTSTPDQPAPTTRRIDALMFDSLIRTAIEVKVSVADAKRDTWQKVWPWMRVTHRFVYAVPAGLIDVPPVYGAGLWWVHPGGRVEVKRKAKVSHTPEPLPQQVVQALAYRACGRNSISPVTVVSPPGPERSS